MSTVSRRARRLAGAVVVSGFCAGLLVTGPARAITANSDRSYLVVYDNNLENQTKPACGYDWEKLYTSIKAQPTSPDIFTVQQISNQAALDALTKRMTEDLPGSYAGVIAVANPTPLSNYDKDHVCKDGAAPAKPYYKRTQTNAVIYRSDRFTTKAEIRWRSDAPDDLGTNHDCRNLTKDNSDGDHDGRNQDRVENVAVRLTDNLAKKDVTVASFHWPTSSPWNGPYCAEENMQEAEDRTAEIGSGTLTVLGGDANTYVNNKNSGTWWQDAIADKFSDPIGGACAASCPTSANTSGGHRIDFMLVKGSAATTGATTISTTATGGKYSDHLALKANVKY